MATTKLSMSFDANLDAAIRRAAAAEHRSVSSWMAAAAEQRLRLIELGQAVSEWESEFGPLSEDEIAAADSIIVKAAKRRGRKTTSRVA